MTTMHAKSNVLKLRAETVGDLMTPNPISLDREMTVRDALASLLDHDVGAAPVINEAGRPMGVISLTDILIHERETSLPAGVQAELAIPVVQRKLRENFQFELADATTVEEVMTPGLFSVEQNHPAAKAVEDMAKYGVHRLFVLDGSGVIVGVLTSMDIIKNLLP